MIQSPLLPHIQGYIDGRWVDADGGESIPVYNPATGEKLGEVPNMRGEETQRAIEAAKAALERPASLEQRRDWLAGIDEGLRANRKEIGRILTMEHGKPWHEGQAEVDYAAGFFRFAAENVHELKSRTIEGQPKGCRWTVHQRPAGVAALITPWNFPIGMIAKKLSASIAADAPAVIKPSSKTPLTMIALFQVLHGRVKLPAGKANLVTGPAGHIGDTLTFHPAVRVVSFTGSTEVGKALMRKGADGMKRLALELGGNAPFVVFDDADLDQAADQLMANKFRGGGQTCVCANRVLVQKGVADAFAQKVKERVDKMTVGDGLKEGTDLGPLIDRSGFDKVRQHVQDALEKGAQRVAGGDPDEPEETHGFFHPPTVLSDVKPNMLCCQEETFGPLVPLLQFEDEAEAVQQANNTEYGLAAYVFTADRERAARIIPRLSFGHVGFNTGTGPTPEAPFGGMKQSGFGREGGLEGLHEFIEPQTVPEPV